MLYLHSSSSMRTQELLRELEDARAAIDPYTRLPDEYTGELRRHVLAQSVHYSTQIEGNTLTLAQVQSVLAGESVGAPADQVREVENYRDAVAYVQSQAAGGHFEVSEDTIRAVHYMISKSLPGQYAPGRYRTTQNYVVDRLGRRRLFIPPAPEEVPALMWELVDWLNAAHDIPVPVKAALAHLNLVAIHPFADGNGRTARVLETMVMYSGGYRSQDLVSLEAYFGRDNQGYYAALRSALGPNFRPDKDVSGWVEYSLQAHVEQAKTSVREIVHIMAEIDAIGEAFASKGLSPWQVVAVWQACSAGRVTNRLYREISGRSAQSAAADLGRLVENGLLERVGRGRSVAYVPSPELRTFFDGLARDLGR